MCFIQTMMQVHMHLLQRTRGQNTYIDWSCLFLEACGACGGTEEHSHFLCVHSAKAVSFTYRNKCRTVWLQNPIGSIIIRAAAICWWETRVKACLLLLARDCTFGACNATLEHCCHADVSNFLMIMSLVVILFPDICEAPAPRLLARWAYGVTMQEMTC